MQVRFVVRLRWPHHQARLHQDDPRIAISAPGTALGRAPRRSAKPRADMQSWAALHAGASIIGEGGVAILLLRPERPQQQPACQDQPALQQAALRSHHSLLWQRHQQAVTSVWDQQLKADSCAARPPPGSCWAKAQGRRKASQQVGCGAHHAQPHMRAGLRALDEHGGAAGHGRKGDDVRQEQPALGPRLRRRRPQPSCSA